MNNSSRYDNTTSNDMAELYESKLMNRSLDQILFEEANSNDETLEEGWWDRAKMRGQQAAGAVQGAVQQGKGKLQQAAGNLQQKAVQTGANAFNKVGSMVGANAKADPTNSPLYQQGQQRVQQGQQNIDQGQQVSQQRLVQAAVKISQARSQTVLNDIATDLQKVGINVKLPPNEVKRIQTVIFNAIQKAIQGG